jgi:hypothetical protein
VTGEGIAAIISAGGALVTSIGTMIMQFRSGKVSQANSDKLDEQGGKIDEVHAATVTLVEATGTHKALPPGS